MGKHDGKSVVTHSEAVLPVGQFGDKTIGYFAGLCLLINNVTGPGLAQMPLVFQQGGWVLSLVLLAVCCAVSGAASLMLLESIKAMPGNSKFEQRIEFMTLANHTFSGPSRRWAFWMTLLFFVFLSLATLISSVIESAQTMDAAYMDMMGKACALQLYRTPPAPLPLDTVGAAVNVTTGFGFVCVDKSTSDGGPSDSPFGDDAYVVSLGFVTVALMAIPLGVFNLDDNIWVQKLAFQMLCVIFTAWIVQCFVEGFHPTAAATSVPAFGADFSGLFGVVLFNFAFVTTLPSWVNEKEIGVPIGKSVWIATVVGTVMFAVLGLVAAGSFDFAGADGGDLLSVFLASNGGVLLRVMVYLFPVAALVTSIPIFSIVVRYNLLENNVTGVFWSNVVAVAIPWLVSIPLYTGSLLNTVVMWSGLFLTVPMNFLLPAYFYLQLVIYEGAGLGAGVEDEVAHLLEADNALLGADYGAADTETPSAAPAPSPALPVLNLPDAYTAGDEVEAWIPGLRWVRCFVAEKAGAHCYAVTDAAEQKIPPETVVPETNLRRAGGADGAAPEDKGKQARALLLARPESCAMSELSPRSLAGQAPGNAEEARRRLDQHEQRIDDLRKKIAALVTKPPPLSDEDVATKKRYQNERFRLQRQVNRLLRRMDEAAGGDCGASSAFSIGPTSVNPSVLSAYRSKLTPLVDELFSALPAGWSQARRRGAAWTLIGSTAVLNVVALVYAIIG